MVTCLPEVSDNRVCEAYNDVKIQVYSIRRFYILLHVSLRNTNSTPSVNDSFHVPLLVLRSTLHVQHSSFDPLHTEEATMCISADTRISCLTRTLHLEQKLSFRSLHDAAIFRLSA